MVEKILTEIYRLKKDLEGYSAVEALDYIESYINILQREQPSLPSNLDEAAEEYAYKTTWDHGVRFDSFKAGAKWDREQMMSKAVEGEVMDFRFMREFNYANAKIQFQN